MSNVPEPIQPEIVDAGSTALDERFTSRPSSPVAVAWQHLRRRKIAMVCLSILIAYFLLAAISYLRLPGTVEKKMADGSVVEVEREFIGEWFEKLASRRLVNDAGDPIVYQAPSFTGAWEEVEQADNADTAADVEPTFEPVEAFWEESQYEQRAAATDLNFLFGTDIQGRSVLWRTLYGTRMSLTIALGAALLAVTIGTTLGALAGYFGGFVDVIITWLFTTIASIPRILLILALAYSLKGKEIDLPIFKPFELSGTLMLILAMGLTSWVGLCRLIRGEVMKQKSMDYESAARAIGLGRGRILSRHMLPNTFYLVIIQFSLLFPLFIHLEVILSYLGLGATDGVSWGQMIDASLLEMMQSPVVWWQLAAASVAVFGISIALNLFGDALRDALDPKLQASS